MKKEVLIVDDEPEIGELMAAILEGEGHRANCATDFQQALGLLGRNQYQILFLDVNLGTSNGLNLLPKARKLQDELRVVVISAYGGEEMRHKAIEEGAEEFILKPFSKKQLLEAVEK